MVVNGQAEFVGSDRDRAEAAIARAGSAPHADVQLKVVSSGATQAELQVRVDSLPGARHGDTVEAVLAIAEDNLRSNVSRGENAGRHLTHTAVTRQIRTLGAAVPGQTFVANPSVTLDTGWKREDWCISSSISSARTETFC